MDPCSTGANCHRALAAFALTLIAFGCSKPAPPAPQPPNVEVAEVIKRDVPIYVEAIGQTRGVEEVEVRARVQGFLESVAFEEGSAIRKGKLLYTIDPREYEAALSQAKGRVAQAQADLARYEQDVARYQPLVEQNALPKQNLDTAVAQANAGHANVEAAQAAVTQAQLNLSYTKIYAPTDGIIGKTEVNVGNLVGQGQNTLLTQISKVATIDVRFTVPERDYLLYARKRQERGGNAASDRSLPFELVLADGSVHPHKGQLAFVDRNVDPVTGTILLEAAFPNPGAIVRPGQFARVRAAVDLKKGAILVPQRAVTELQGIYNVAVVGSGDTVEIRMVTTAERIGTLWVIDSGLKAGDRIVVEGLQKVRAGMKVKPAMVAIKDEQSATPITGATADAKDAKE
jgi:membrane fusion protein (multidrug efflux system)